jgi:hypothetical protein
VNRAKPKVEPPKEEPEVKVEEEGDKSMFKS